MEPVYKCSEQNKRSDNNIRLHITIFFFPSICFTHEWVKKHQDEISFAKFILRQDILK